MGGTSNFCRNQKLFAYARMGFVIVWFPVTKRFFLILCRIWLYYCLASLAKLFCLIWDMAVMNVHKGVLTSKKNFSS